MSFKIEIYKNYIHFLMTNHPIIPIVLFKKSRKKAKMIIRKFFDKGN